MQSVPMQEVTEGLCEDFAELDQQLHEGLIKTKVWLQACLHRACMTEPYHAKCYDTAQITDNVICFSCRSDFAVTFQL